MTEITEKEIKMFITNNFETIKEISWRVFVLENRHSLTKNKYKLNKKKEDAICYPILRNFKKLRRDKGKEYYGY